MNNLRISVYAIAWLCCSCASLSCSSRQSRAGGGGTGSASANGTGGAQSSTGGSGGARGGTGGTGGVHTGTGGAISAVSSGTGTGGAGTGGAGRSPAAGTGGVGAAGHGGGGAGAGGAGSADAGIPQACQLSVDIATCYQMNAPCVGGRFVYNAQNGTCDEVCLCKGSGTFDTRAACQAACIDAVPQSACSVAHGACTPDQYTACPVGQEPIYPQPKRDCPAGGHCCVTGSETTCGANGVGECLVGSKCISPGLTKSNATCEPGRVCCEPSTHGGK
jgi:hypothetical protein